MPELTIAVVAWERFSVAARVLRRLVEVTPQPYRLVVVDAGTPWRYRDEMEQAVAGHPDVEFLRTSDYMMPSAAKRWAIEQVNDSEFILLTHNDIEPSFGWTERLLAACREEDADVGRPSIMEIRAGRTRCHFNPSLGGIETLTNSRGTLYSFRKSSTRAETLGERRRCTAMESHCLLVRRSVFEKTKVFDERLSPVAADADISLELYTNSIPVIFEPASRVTFLSPPPIQREEREFFNFVWDKDAAAETAKMLHEKWNIAQWLVATQFAKDRQAYTSYWRFWAYWLRHELWQVEIDPIVRYRLFQMSKRLPAPLQKRMIRMLYG